jgi:hypothetical protein
MFLVGLGLAATGLHWLVTPTAHPGASTALVLAVWLQLAIGATLAIAGHRRDRRDRQALGASYHPLAAAAASGLAGALLTGTAGHWLITPAAHPAAPLWHFVVVWGQAALGLGLVVAASRRASLKAAT